MPEFADRSYSELGLGASDTIPKGYGRLGPTGTGTESRILRSQAETPTMTGVLDKGPP